METTFSRVIRAGWLVFAFTALFAAWRFVRFHELRVSVDQSVGVSVMNREPIRLNVEVAKEPLWP
jgi:hypothetical protein